jgi:hypothetical protein
MVEKDRTNPKVIIGVDLDETLFEVGGYYSKGGSRSPHAK